MHAWVSEHNLTYGFSDDTNCPAQVGVVDSHKNTNRRYAVDGGQANYYGYDNADRIV